MIKPASISTGPMPADSAAARVPDDAATGRHSAARFPFLRPMRPEELPALRAAAATDAHQPVMPTHLVVRLDEEGREEIVGYASLQAVALLNVWVHSEKVRARESLMLLNTAENVAACNNLHVCAMPCAQQSPFRNLMHKLGYQFLGDTGLFIKRI